MDMRDRDAPTGALLVYAAVYAAGIFLFGGAGVAVGIILAICGKPWHRILVCGGIGAAIGFVTSFMGIWLGRTARKREEGDNDSARGLGGNWR